MIELKNSLTNTQQIAQLIIDSHRKDYHPEINAAKQCLIDYLSCIEAAKNVPAVINLANTLANEHGNAILLGQQQLANPERAALFNGFAGHYLDFDDVQANLRGHSSVVIFSALLALDDHNESMDELLFAYVIGVELASQIGKQVNPNHKLSGYHTTTTIGVFGAVAAISKFKHLNRKQTVQLLSFAATQSAGLGLEVGSDTKPLHAGLAARNAVQAYQFMISGLTTNADAFNDLNGWSKVVVNQSIDVNELVNSWLNPAQISTPGIWFKSHQFCSAAMSGNDAAEQAYRSGIRLSNIQKVIFHFRKDEDRVLRYRMPNNGQEGKFSIEYIFWQIIKNGQIDDRQFDRTVTTTAFRSETNNLFTRVNDLAPGSTDDRVILLSIILKDGVTKEFYVQHPKGSPNNQLDFTAIVQKLIDATNQQNTKIDVQQLITMLTDKPVSDFKKELQNL